MNNYEILGVSPNASKAEIKKAYRKMSLIYHPDVGGDEKQFLKIKEAYEILTIDRFDPSKTHCQHVPKSRGFVQFVSSHSDMAGNITHEIFFSDVVSAQTDIHKNMKHSWNLEHHHFGASLLVSKKFLLACNYQYKLYFYAKDGSIIVTQQSYKDPRSTIVKLWDKIFN